MNRIAKYAVPCALIAAALSACETADTMEAPEMACVELAAGSCQPVAAGGGASIVWQWVPAEGGICVPPADVRYYDTPDSCGM